VSGVQLFDRGLAQLAEFRKCSPGSVVCPVSEVGLIEENGAEFSSVKGVELNERKKRSLALRAYLSSVSET
jgi:hypothetical protein